MAYIQLRIDDKTKSSAKKILDKLGVDMSSAVKVYLKQIVINQGIPFRLITENGFTPEEEQGILKASEEARRGQNITEAMSPKDAIEYLNGLK